MEKQESAPFKAFTSAAVIFFSIAGSFVTVGMYYGNINQRVAALEENKTEVIKRLDRIEANMANKDDFRELRQDVKEMSKGKR